MGKVYTKSKKLFAGNAATAAKVEVVDSMVQPVSNGPPSKPQPAAQSGPVASAAPLIKPKVQQPDSDQMLMAELDP